MSACGPLERPVDLVVSINATRQSEGKSPHTIFVVLVKYNDKAWTTSKRFSQFVTLREKLLKLMGKIPALPAKTWTRSFDAAFIKQRRDQLTTWVKHLASQHALVNSKDFLAFLQVPTNVPELDVAALPQLIKSVEEPKFGVHAFHYDEQRGVLITACENMSAASRLDTQLCNVKMPWEKRESFSKLPMGCFTVWTLDNEKAWCPLKSTYFSKGVTCLAFEPERQYIMVGLGSGGVLLYHLDLDSRELAKVAEIKVHSDRVTAMVYCSQSDALISISRDKSLNVYHLKEDRSNCAIIGSAWLSALVHDPVAQRAYVGSYNQKILVVDLAGANPHVIHTIEGHTGSVRCLQYNSGARQLLSGSFDHTGGIWSIDPANASRCRNTGWLSGGPAQKVKAVLHLTCLKLILTGHDEGYISIWNSSGLLLHTIEAHKRDITAFKWLDAACVLVSSSKDGKIKFWQFPTPKSGVAAAPSDF